MDSYLVLLRVGFTIATTVTKHAVRSYRTFSPLPDRNRGGSLSVALSVGSRPPGVTWHSALWSPDFPPSKNRQRSPDQLASHSSRAVQNTQALAYNLRTFGERRLSSVLELQQALINLACL